VKFFRLISFWYQSRIIGVKSGEMVKNGEFKTVKTSVMGSKG
jgi:hypothetical protein